MNRFSRLAQLRRTQEDVKAMAFGRVMAHLLQLRQQLAQLDEETAQGRVVSLEDVPRFEARLPPGLYEDYFRGQSWRRERLLQTIRQTEEELEKSRAIWHAARVQMKQVEELVEKENQRMHQDALRREMHELDGAGALHYLREIAEEARQHEMEDTQPSA